MNLIRPIVYGVSLLLAIALLVFSAAPERSYFFGFGTFALLFLSLIPGGVYALFPNGVGRVPFQKAKKALGISSFFFAVVYAFFGWRSGLFSDRFIPSWALLAGAGALLVLAVLTITSVKAIKHRMRPWWKPLHRSVYVAGALAATHIYGLLRSLQVAHEWRIMFWLLVIALTLIQLIRFVRSRSSPLPKE